MLSKQAEKLKLFRDRFISDNGSVSRLLDGQDPKTFRQSTLEQLTLEDLKYLASFPEKVRPVFVDASLTLKQLFDEDSPVLDLAQTTMSLDGKSLGSAVGTTIHDLKELRLERMKLLKAKLDALDLERFADLNLKALFDDVGLNEKTCTISSLRELDISSIANKVKEEILGVFGYNKLLNFATPNGEAIDISLLEEINPVLFEQLTEELVNGYAEQNLRKRGIVRGGNTQLRFFGEKELEIIRQVPEPELMVVIDLGVRQESFPGKINPMRSFPNTPDYKHKPEDVEGPYVAHSNWRKTLTGKDKKAIEVKATLFRLDSFYYMNFGRVRAL